MVTVVVAVAVIVSVVVVVVVSVSALVGSSRRLSGTLSNYQCNPRVPCTRHKAMMLSSLLPPHTSLGRVLDSIWTELNVSTIIIETTFNTTAMCAEYST